jgi:hypothetical protein
MCPNLEPDRAGSRHRFRCVPLYAAARRAGAVSTRYFLPRRPRRVPHCAVRGPAHSRNRQLLGQPGTRPPTHGLATSPKEVLK